MNNLIELGSEISRNTNCHLLGDCSGKTISRRTGLGLRRILDLKVSPKKATEFAHYGMATSFVLLSSNNPKAKSLGKLVASGLVLSYLIK